jgi:hypothetical protein
MPVFLDKLGAFAPGRRARSGALATRVATPAGAQFTTRHARSGGRDDTNATAAQPFPAAPAPFVQYKM